MTKEFSNYKCQNSRFQILQFGIPEVEVRADWVDRLAFGAESQSGNRMPHSKTWRKFWSAAYESTSWVGGSSWCARGPLRQRALPFGLFGAGHAALCWLVRVSLPRLRGGWSGFFIWFAEVFEGFYEPADFLVV